MATLHEVMSQHIILLNDRPRPFGKKSTTKVLGELIPVIKHSN